MIVLVPYRRQWPVEFDTIGRRLRLALGERAVRIDHIGSTAVPDLPAKDIIDIQVTVRSLEPAVETALVTAGYKRIERITQDHVPPGHSNGAGEWSKWIFMESPGTRETHIHVRRDGQPNQRYSLLFRDYLRAHPTAAEAYARVKAGLARLHPDNLDAYYEVKDPVCDVILEAAEVWASSTGWVPGPSDC